MKKILVSFIVVTMCIVLPVSVMAATDAEIQTAIDNGLNYLAVQQTGGGYWNYSGYEQAATGAAVGALVSQQSHWGDAALGGASNIPVYQAKVDSAMNWLLNNATLTSVSTRADGVNICGGGSCNAVYWYGAGETTYTTGLVASAIGQYAASIPSPSTTVATTSGPLAGMTWTQISQGIVNTWAAGQTTSAAGSLRGGWRYFPGTEDSDGSTTQWAVLSMIYAQTLGATVPAITKSELSYWLTADQNVNGGGQYQPGNSIIDNSDTGSLLIGHAFLGDSKSNPQVQAALAWLNTNWPYGPSGTWYGNFGNPYAMWADYKALELYLGLTDNTTILNLLNATCSGGGFGTPDSGICNWWQDYNQWLVANQNLDGSWNGTDYWTGVLATSFDVSILGGTVIPLPPVGTPEPATLLLLGLGLAGLGVIRKKI